MERGWSLAVQKGSNHVALGYDEGCVLIQLGREEPAMSMDGMGKILWAKHAEIQQVVPNMCVTLFMNVCSVNDWKKVEEYLRLFETYGGIGFSLFLMGSLRKLMCFSGRMTLRMKLIAKKELILFFQMTPSRILCD